MLSYPFSCEINITNNCNLNCYFCSMDSKRVDDFNCINSENIEIIASKLREMKCIYVSLSGGEPMTHPNFYDIVKILKQYGFRVTLTTNGTLITESTIKKIKDIGIEWVQISLHSINDSTCKKIMGSNVQKRIMDAIELVRKAEVGLSVCVVKNEYNKNEIDEISQYIKEKDINIIYREEIPVGKIKGKMDNVSKYNFEELFNEYLKNRDDANSIIRKFAIMTNGDIVTCSELGVKLGNIFTDDLEKIWRTSKVLGLCKGCGKTPCLAYYYHNNQYIHERVDELNDRTE